MRSPTRWLAPVIALAGVLFCSLGGCDLIVGIPTEYSLAVDAGLPPPVCATCFSANDGGVTSWCGPRDDGCGHVLMCGGCSGSAVCTYGVCTCPTTCAQLGASCGTQPDMCGGVLPCGACDAPAGCVDNKCVCQPIPCAAQGASCGVVPDGCGGTFVCSSDGGTVDAGDDAEADGGGVPPTCAGAQTCGGGGVANTCGTGTCVPKTSCAGKCGTISDTCGGAVACGGCPAGQTCGGGPPDAGDASATPNRCGCTPKTCDQIGAACGTPTDGCGGTLDCGTCEAGTCVKNACSCTPTTCQALGATCGVVSDGCNGALDCGSCPSGQTCQTGAPANHCGS